MLLNICIRDFGIIDRLEITFQEGFNVLTGETGSGKSIIIEALQLALGGRASAEQIRSGAEKSVVEAVFLTSGVKPAQAAMKECGVEQPEDGIVVLSREISRSGKNICRVNGQIVSLGVYRKIGGCLADLHMQGEQGALADQDRQLLMLDRFGGADLLRALEDVQRTFLKLKEARARFEKISGDAAERVKRTDLLRYQVDEISGAALQPGEDVNLSEEKKLLENLEKISFLSGEAYFLLYGGGPGQSPVVDQLSKAVGLLRNLGEYDGSSRGILDSAEGALYMVEDAARALLEYRDRIDCRPKRLEEVDERLELIKNLKRKYGETVEDILRFLDRARDELETLESAEEEMELAAARLKEMEEAYRQAARILSEERKRAAKRLEEAVSGELASLEMGKVDFKVSLKETGEPGMEGAERAVFLISTNPGEPLKPLSKIASGGELTRIMLALKALLAGSDEIPVLVFDEADNGIGGRALQAVAEKMSQLSRHRQVISVTHSAQVACHARSHHRIYKEFDGRRNVTRIQTLERADRLEELARMLGGKQVTEIARQHAGQLLRLAKNKNGNSASS
ncbi:MAG TPA: DNA repair protein RecN [Bacillota bacterium]|nr:DNA repair protein RecN [Bacillota bacterium]